MANRGGDAFVRGLLEKLLQGDAPAQDELGLLLAEKAESTFLDFKSGRLTANKSYLKTTIREYVAAFANGDGGILCIGPNNQRTWIRSMLERFHWRRVGGSVFRYSAPEGHEDWLNHIIPSLMLMRAYLLRHQIALTCFTLDAAGTSFVDTSDSSLVLGSPPLAGARIPLARPTNQQSAEQSLRTFVDNVTQAAP